MLGTAMLGRAMLGRARNLRHGMIILGLAGLTACSSAPKREGAMSEALITTITEDGLRQFTYEVAQGRGGAGGRRGGGGGGPGMGGSPPDRGERPGRGGGGRDRNSDEQMMERLSERLEATGYCPDGWFVIRQENDRNIRRVIGECKSVAEDDSPAA